VNDLTVAHVESSSEIGSVPHVPRSTVADLVIEDLAAENALQAERIADLKCERETYRELVQATLAAAHALTRT